MIAKNNIEGLLPRAIDCKAQSVHEIEMHVNVTLSRVRSFLNTCLPIKLIACLHVLYRLGRRSQSRQSGFRTDRTA